MGERKGRQGREKEEESKQEIMNFKQIAARAANPAGDCRASLDGHGFAVEDAASHHSSVSCVPSGHLHTVMKSCVLRTPPLRGCKSDLFRTEQKNKHTKDKDK